MYKLISSVDNQIRSIIISYFLTICLRFTSIWRQFIESTAMYNFPISHYVVYSKIALGLQKFRNGPRGKLSFCASKMKPYVV